MTYVVHPIVDQVNTQLAILLVPFDAPGAYKNGTEFMTPKSSQQQVGVIRREAGSTIKPHTHKVRKLLPVETGEVLVVLKGKIKVNVYDVRAKYCGCLNAEQGSVVVLMKGGHSVEFVEDSELLEVKTGPYQGRDADKIDIEVQQ